MRITAIIQITYEVDEADYPDGVEESDIRDETEIWRKTVNTVIADECLDATIDDITVKAA